VGWVGGWGWAGGWGWVGGEGGVGGAGGGGGGYHFENIFIFQMLGGRSLNQD